VVMGIRCNQEVTDVTSIVGRCWGKLLRPCASVTKQYNFKHVKNVKRMHSS